jgi:hypothetical protein
LSVYTRSRKQKDTDRYRLAARRGGRGFAIPARPELLPEIYTQAVKQRDISDTVRNAVSALQDAELREQDYVLTGETTYSEAYADDIRAGLFARALMPMILLGHIVAWACDMPCVYYSLVLTNNQATYQRQWMRSIRSLRQHNATIPVYLFVFNTPPDALLDAAERYHVTLRHLGDYRDHIGKENEALSCMPTLSKLLPLGFIAPDISQVLFVDCDTFFFADVEALFHKYRECDFYAREEVFSRRSVLFPYNPGYVDEDVLQTQAMTLDIEPIPPYNSGVFLLNGPVRRDLVALQKDFFCFAWKLAAGASLRLDTKIHPEVKMRASEWLKGPGNQPMVYPAKNFWIFEQIALWLTLGRIPGLSHGQFAVGDVLQGLEFALFRSFGRCTVAHYFSRLESRFVTHAGIDDDAFRSTESDRSADGTIQIG